MGLFSTKPWTPRSASPPPLSEEPNEGFEWRREHVIDHTAGYMGPQWVQVPTRESMDKQAELAAFIAVAESEAEMELTEPLPGIFDTFHQNLLNVGRRSEPDDE